MTNNETVNTELTELCKSVKEKCMDGDYKGCLPMIYESMFQNPDNPEPHNLLGLLLEKRGEHAKAMRHFRAAAALDPSYLPAQKNMDLFGLRSVSGDGFFDAADCTSGKTRTCVVIYNVRGFRRCEKAI